MACVVTATPYGMALVVSSTTRPTTAPDLSLGRVIYEADTGRFAFWNGSTWASLRPTAGRALITATVTSATTETGAQATITIADQGCTGQLTAWLNAYTTGSVAGDAFEMRLKNNGTVFASGRETVPATSSIQFSVNGSVSVPAGTAMSITAHAVRLAGTGTLTTFTDGVLDTISAIWTPT